MSVLVEVISVVVRKSTIWEKSFLGLAQYKSECPNSTYCADDYLVRVGFMAPVDVVHFIQGLEQQGFFYYENEYETHLPTPRIPVRSRNSLLPRLYARLVQPVKYSGPIWPTWAIVTTT